MKSSASAAEPAGQSVFLGLGANLGNRLSFLQRALMALAELPTVCVIQKSSVYESEPIGYTDQGNFLNMVAEVETTASPLQLLREIQRIESRLGRVRLQRWGPRTIDIDILCWSGHVISEGALQIPHAELHNRKFVLAPFAEIAPDFKVPPQFIRILDLLAKTTDQAAVKMLDSTN